LQRQETFHYMHRITINSRDILPYKAILIYDQISLIEIGYQFRPALESLLNIESVLMSLS
jgi:hypothetical protein